MRLISTLDLEMSVAASPISTASPNVSIDMNQTQWSLQTQIEIVYLTTLIFSLTFLCCQLVATAKTESESLFPKDDKDGDESNNDDDDDDDGDKSDYKTGGENDEKEGDVEDKEEK